MSGFQSSSTRTDWCTSVFLGELIQELKGSMFAEEGAFMRGLRERGGYDPRVITFTPLLFVQQHRYANNAGARSTYVLSMQWLDTSLLKS